MQVPATSQPRGRLKVRKPGFHPLFNLRIGRLGRLWFTRDLGEAFIGAKQTFISHLTIRRYVGDELVATYDMGSGVVTTAGANLWAQDWTSATAFLKLANYHDSGSGTNAAVIGDTVLQTPLTGSQIGGRATGVQSNASNVYKTIGVIQYNTGVSVAEWGLFTASVGGTLADRRVFSALPLGANDKLEFDYTLTVVPGG